MRVSAFIDGKSVIFVDISVNGLDIYGTYVDLDDGQLKVQKFYRNNTLASSEFATDAVVMSEGGGGGEGGTTDHSQLTNRDALDQHPISSITNLTTELDSKESILTFLGALQRSGNNISLNSSLVDHNQLLNYSIGEHRTINDSTSAVDSLWSSSKISSELSTKQSSLGFTPEDSANKENTVLDNSTSKYPTINLLKTNLDLKADTSGANFTGNIDVPDAISATHALNLRTAEDNFEFKLVFEGLLQRTYNTVSLEVSAIDHNQLQNYTIEEHRVINDSVTSGDSLWSSSKISSELSAKEDSANKENIVLDNSTTKYPTINLLKTSLDLKADTSGATFTGEVNVPDATSGTHALNLQTAQDKFESSLTFEGLLQRTSNTVSLEVSAIDHNQLQNYTIEEHRTINDSTSALDSLWSSSKISSELTSKEDSANKENSVLDNSTTKYPTINLLKTNLDLKADTSGANFTGIVSSVSGFDVKSESTVETPTSGFGRFSVKNGVPIFKNDAGVESVLNTSGGGSGGESLWSNTAEEDGIEYQDGLVRVGDVFEQKAIVPPSTGKVGYGRFFVSSVDGLPYYLHESGIAKPIITPDIEYWENYNLYTSNNTVSVTGFVASIIPIPVRLIGVSVTLRHSFVFQTDAYHVLIYENETLIYKGPRVRYFVRDFYTFTFPSAIEFIPSNLYRIGIIRDVREARPNAPVFAAANGLNSDYFNFSGSNVAHDEDPLIDNVPHTLLTDVVSATSTGNHIWCRINKF